MFPQLPDESQHTETYLFTEAVEEILFHAGDGHSVLRPFRSAHVGDKGTQVYFYDLEQSTCSSWDKKLRHKVTEKNMFVLKTIQDKDILFPSIITKLSVFHLLMKSTVHTLNAVVPQRDEMVQCNERNVSISQLVSLAVTFFILLYILLNINCTRSYVWAVTMNTIKYYYKTCYVSYGFFRLKNSSRSSFKCIWLINEILFYGLGEITSV